MTVICIVMSVSDMSLVEQQLAVRKQQLLLIFAFFCLSCNNSPIPLSSRDIRCIAVLYLHLKFVSLFLLWECIFHQLITLIGASDVLFMPFWFHSISAIGINIQSKEIQLCQELSGSACPVLHLFHIHRRDFFCTVDLLIFFLPIGVI